MINTATLLGFAVLAVRKQIESTVEYWKPSKKDVETLEAKMKNFSCETRNGRKQYPFELYLESEDIISFGEYGQIQVRNPLMYDRMNRTEALRAYIADEELKRILEQFPEERAAHQKKLKQLISSLKSTVDNVSFAA